MRIDIIATLPDPSFNGAGSPVNRIPMLATVNSHPLPTRTSSGQQLCLVFIISAVDLQ
jgi:hypothetical protein